MIFVTTVFLLWLLLVIIPHFLFLRFSFYISQQHFSFFKALVSEIILVARLPLLMKAVHVELANERGIFFMFKVLRQNFGLKFLNILNYETVTVVCPAYDILVISPLKNLVCISNESSWCFLSFHQLIFKLLQPSSLKININNIKNRHLQIAYEFFEKLYFPQRPNDKIYQSNFIDGTIKLSKICNQSKFLNKNMQESHSLDLKYQIVCKRLHPGKMMCISPNCQDSAPCCLVQTCQACTKSHLKCKLIRTQIFINRINAKKQPITQEILAGIKAMEKAYDEAIDRLSKDKEFITSQLDMFGYNQAEVQFMNFLLDGLANCITGKLNSKVIKNIEIKSQWLVSQQSIQKYWKRKQSLFTDIFDKFKDVGRIRIPKLESKITDETDLIMEFFAEDYQIQKITLLFRASQNDFQVSRFHAVCDGKKHTLVLARTQFGRIIGGYSHIPWGNNGYGHDIQRKNFLFSVSNKEKYPCIHSQYGNYSNMTYGPTFGGGHDFYIGNRSNTQNASYFNFPYSFNNGKQVAGQSSYLSFSGATNNYNARVMEWQVFQLELV